MEGKEAPADARGNTNTQERGKMNHTPTPWNVYITQEHMGYILGPRPAPNLPERPIATILEYNYSHPSREESKANAEFIVLAANCHDELVEALKGFVEVHRQFNNMLSLRMADDAIVGCMDALMDSACYNADTALAKAERKVDTPSG